MLVRHLMLIANVGIFAAVLVIDTQFAGASTWVFYVLLVWIIASIFIYRLPVMNRRIGGPPMVPGPTGTTTAPSIAPATPSAAPLPSTADLGFCIHCGTVVSPGVTRCPTCGRPTSY